MIAGHNRKLKRKFLKNCANTCGAKRLFFEANLPKKNARIAGIFGAKVFSLKAESLP
jgi:hypothetical protein